MLKRIFIANRGDIARRIALSARKMGAQTVCLSDQETPPGYLWSCVDRIIKVEEESPALYLDAKEMIRLALESGCDSVHPGFGFLSENSEFAEAVGAAGLTWIGPSPEVIRIMGNKSQARAVAEKSGVPCLTGLKGISPGNPEHRQGVVDFAERAGFPLLIKASLGGGGKGMRIVRAKPDLLPSLERAGSEAANAFGSDSLIIEKYCERSRHVEVQILGDQSGNVLALGDRDCSLQRRHQKIIEEAPAPFLSPELREKLHAAGVSLAKEVGYTSAGTVEFLLDYGSSERNPELWFLEMNTRLQVEHPVTEEIFGTDLVAWQIRIARGESLSEELCSRKPRGHSVEARLYGEDPLSGFMPAPGPVSVFLPGGCHGIRWETGLDEVDEISGRFDPMVARVVATAETRDEALSALSDALRSTFFGTEKNNREYLAWLCDHKGFREGAFDSGFIADHQTSYERDHQASRERLGLTAGELIEKIRQERPVLAGSAHELKESFSVNEISMMAFSGSGQGLVAGSEFPESSRVIFGRRKRFFSPARTGVSLWGEGQIENSAGGGIRHFEFLIEKKLSGEKIWLLLEGCLFWEESSQERRVHGSSGTEDASGILAPVPGKVVRILGADGGQIEAGSPVMILESMKMEFEVKSPISGKIEQILVEQGQQVDSGQVLARLESDT